MANFEIDELIKQIVRTRKGITREFVISTLKRKMLKIRTEKFQWKRLRSITRTYILVQK